MKVYTILSFSIHSPYSPGNQLFPIIGVSLLSRTNAEGGQVTQAEQIETPHPLVKANGSHMHAWPNRANYLANQMVTANLEILPK